MHKVLIFALLLSFLACSKEKKEGAPGTVEERCAASWDIVKSAIAKKDGGKASSERAKTFFLKTCRREDPHFYECAKKFQGQEGALSKMEECVRKQSKNKRKSKVSRGGDTPEKKEMRRQAKAYATSTRTIWNKETKLFRELRSEAKAVTPESAARVGKLFETAKVKYNDLLKQLKGLSPQSDELKKIWQLDLRSLKLRLELMSLWEPHVKKGTPPDIAKGYNKYRSGYLTLLRERNKLQREYYKKYRGKKRRRKFKKWKKKRRKWKRLQKKAPVNPPE